MQDPLPSAPIKRPGSPLVATIPEGAKTMFLKGGRLVVVHPERPPYIIEPDGSETLLDVRPNA